MNYFVDFSENGIPAMKVSEMIAEKFQTQILAIKIIATDPDTGDESIVETIKIDVSCLLFPRKNL